MQNGIALLRFCRYVWLFIGQIGVYFCAFSFAVVEWREDSPADQNYRIKFLDCEEEFNLPKETQDWRQGKFIDASWTSFWLLESCQT